jgi:hypothetical protein|tara:strand:+ start:11594 stop:12607 length:1014 start_codon:yes stop_codon:yes gene_type:complete
MAWGNLPFSVEENFELGTRGNFDSESDTGSLLDFPHYATLAAFPAGGVPYRGAYCMRIVAGDTNDHTLTEGAVNVADNNSGYIRFALYIDAAFAATANDIFNIFEWQNGGVVEHSISLQITASDNLVEIGMGDGTEASVFSSPLSKGVWHIVENHLLVDTGDVGTSELWIDGKSVVTLASLDHSGAITDGILGTQNTLATTTGTLLFDQWAFDTARIGVPQDRWTNEVLMTQSGHAFVGPGIINNVSLMDANATGDVVTIYDTDDANTIDQSNIAASLTATAANELVDPAGMPVRVKRGAYIEKTAAIIGALVQVREAVAWGSDGAVRGYGQRRKNR